ncbi:MAG: substrate-binding domain-containing protein [Ruminococcus flavefaciens]|nr:substrate-binding domain-containing protein [Ruminococcus flavefaciens]
MKKNMKKLLSIFTLGALTASLAFSGGCGKDDDEDYIAVVSKSLDQYWDATKKGVEDAGEEMKIKVTYDASEKEDVTAQVKYVNKAISNKADVIVIAPVEDTDELAEALKKAQSNGINVITIDSDVREEVRSSCISTNNTYGGAIAGRKMSEILGGHGNIGIITHIPTSSTAIERKGGFISQIEEYNAEAGEDVLNILATESGDGDIQKSKEAALKIIKDNPDIDAIYATNQGSTIGACLAVDELGKADSIQIIGFDSFNKGDGFESAESYTESGVLDGFIVQNPYNMGYLGVRYAKDIINGQTISTAIDTGATLVTKDNINDSDVKLIMNPMEY